MRGRSRRTFTLLPLLVGACQSWQSVPLAPTPSGALPSPSWVMLKGGAEVLVENGRFTPDSILGLTSGSRPFAVSRDSVASVEARRYSLGLSIGVVMLGGIVATLLVLLLMLSGDDS
jgi:hypothetical protein